MSVLTLYRLNYRFDAINSPSSERFKENQCMGVFDEDHIKEALEMLSNTIDKTECTDSNWDIINNLPHTKIKVKGNDLWSIWYEEIAKSDVPAVKIESINSMRNYSNKATILDVQVYLD